MSDFCYWAALRLQINRERVAESFLPRFGFDTFYVPRARTFHVRYNRRIEIHRPFLPGYGFVLITLQWHSLKTCPGVIGPVRDGGPQGQPARVPEDVIAAIRARERDGAIDPPKMRNGPRAPQVGDKIRIRDGPFGGHIGLVARTGRRLGVILFILNGQRQVELKKGAVEVVW